MPCALARTEYARRPEWRRAVLLCQRAWNLQWEALPTRYATIARPILGLGLSGPPLRAVQNRSRRFCAGPSWASAFQARRGHWQRPGHRRYSARPPSAPPEEISTMGDFTTLMARDGHEFQAYLAAPAARPRGAVVVIQEI